MGSSGELMHIMPKNIEGMFYRYEKSLKKLKINVGSLKMLCYNII